MEKLIAANDLGPVVNPEAELRIHVAQRLGPCALDTHDWFYTPGSGAMIDQLLGRLPIEERGAVLPTYQGLGRSARRDA
ncbi:hypothetical protein AB0C12_42945 [Actinoplanes sp. NPDC048967]|uniref:hypothetical protein n=1 Tax=Actinoplanes sp. NPDC048967 TaxID=3155269 RepID=UPI0033C0D951